MGTLVRRNLARVQANRASTASGLHSFSLPRVLASRNGRLFDDLAGLLPPQEKFYRTFFDKPRGNLSAIRAAEYRSKGTWFSRRKKLIFEMDQPIGHC